MSHFIVINRNKHNKIVAVHEDIGNACEEQMVLSERFPTDTFEVVDTRKPIVPASMDVPLTRRDTRTIGNLTWLLRNLAIRNKAHPQFDAVFKKLKAEFAGRTRG